MNGEVLNHEKTVSAICKDNTCPFHDTDRYWPYNSTENKQTNINVPILPDLSKSLNRINTVFLMRIFIF